MSSSQIKRLLLYAVVILVVVLAVGYYFTKNKGASPAKVADSSKKSLSVPDPKTYQVVFLSNNQAYFGKLKDINSPYVVLDDVFYLNTPQSTQTQSKFKGPNFDLFKLGSNEIYGPEDTMLINRDHVMWWDNLTSDSKVIKAIEKYKEQQKKKKEKE